MSQPKRFCTFVLLLALAAGCGGRPAPLDVVEDDELPADAGGEVDRSGPAAGVGDPCPTGSGCQVGLICMTDVGGFPSGYCTRVCTPGESCGAGAICMVSPQHQAPGFCMRPCDAEGRCRSGYACGQFPAGARPPACWPWPAGE